MKMTSWIDFFIPPGGTLRVGNKVHADGYCTVLVADIDDSGYSACAVVPVETFESLSPQEKDELKWEQLNELQKSLMSYIELDLFKDIEDERLEIARACLGWRR